MERKKNLEFYTVRKDLAAVFTVGEKGKTILILICFSLEDLCLQLARRQAELNLPDIATTVVHAQMAGLPQRSERVVVELVGEEAHLLHQVIVGEELVSTEASINETLFGGRKPPQA